MTYYEILKVARDADQATIKKAHRELSKIYHPDMPTGNEELFMKINEAYKILYDPQERAAYDQDLDNGGKKEPVFRPDQNSDLYSNIFKSKTGVVGKRGANRTAEVTLTFEEVIHGVQKEVNVRVADSCESCKGTGKNLMAQLASCPTCAGTKKVVSVTRNPFGHEAQTTRTCPDCRGVEVEEEKCLDCNGQGTKNSMRKVTVNIHPNIKDGERVRVKGYGAKGKDGGEDGDLIVTVRTQSSDIFTQVDNNLLYTHRVKFNQLVLGDTLEIPSPEGPQILRIPRGTQLEEKFTLPGLGIRSPLGRRRGSLIVSLELEIPKEITQEQEDLLRQLNL